MVPYHWGGGAGPLGTTGDGNIYIYIYICIIYIYIYSWQKGLTTCFSMFKQVSPTLAPLNLEAPPQRHAAHSCPVTGRERIAFGVDRVQWVFPPHTKGESSGAKNWCQTWCQELGPRIGAEAPSAQWPTSHPSNLYGRTRLPEGFPCLSWNDMTCPIAAPDSSPRS